MAVLDLGQLQSQSDHVVRLIDPGLDGDDLVGLGHGGDDVAHAADNADRHLFA